MTVTSDEAVFEAVKPFALDWRATFPAEGSVTYTLRLNDGRAFAATESGTVELVHLAHARAQKAAWRAAYDALVAEGAIAAAD